MAKARKKPRLTTWVKTQCLAAGSYFQVVGLGAMHAYEYDALAATGRLPGSMGTAQARRWPPACVRHPSHVRVAAGTQNVMGVFGFTYVKLYCRGRLPAAKFIWCTRSAVAYRQACGVTWRDMG
jgi:hypothetical protein